MLRFSTKDNELVVAYQVELASPDYISKTLEEDGEVPVYKVFHFRQRDVIRLAKEEDRHVESAVFRLGTVEGSYYKIEGRKLGISDDVFIDQSFSDIHSSAKTYRAERGISIFVHLHRVVAGAIAIGGDRAGNLPPDAFRNLVRAFPNSYEIGKYADARIAAIVGDYFYGAAGVMDSYQTYLNKRVSVRGRSLLEIYAESEQQKYRDVHAKLVEMLAAEEKYNERQWQKEILEIIRLLYPKYVFVLEGAHVRDSYTGTDRQIDILLVDANGHIDIVELKKPFGIDVMSKTQYRDNYVPLRELAGTVMQVEKYIYYLNKSGKQGEDRLSQQLAKKKGIEVPIRITNPSGIIIMGRETGLNDQQLQDLEIVKRKYKNVIDIITYDDLLQRINSIVNSFTKI